MELLTEVRRMRMARRKLPVHNTMDDAVRLLREAKNIIVLTGAGVSARFCSCFSLHIFCIALFLRSTLVRAPS